ncbi:MAG: hypothetical protein A2506_13320 [Elusimicrobia bacterium RIFOXYD12_FULL_66_9]|nr:MAG: hypothetical protein A2506_13320 [Elusimicrobia bacterium RIFOXYD12_FULL_66_9]
MVHVALLAAVLAVPSQAAPVAAPMTFDASVFNTLSHIAQIRAASVKKMDAGLASRLNRLAWDMRRSQQQTSQLRNELTRMRSRLVVIPGRPTDPSLAFDVRRLSQDFQQLAHDLQWHLQDTRMIRSDIQGKDPDLVGPASYFASEVRWLANETQWLDMDVRNISWDLRAHGFPFEAMDMEAAARDIQTHLTGLKTESDLITAKVR